MKKVGAIGRERVVKPERRAYGEWLAGFGWSSKCLPCRIFGFARLRPSTIAVPPCPAAVSIFCAARTAPCASAGQPRSRETSALSASVTTHLARATASFGPKARAARHRRSFARTRSPICAIAMPRSASAGASSRRATRFNAPRGSPAASARAAAVIGESIGIPSHLSLPPFDTWR
jgi:hypothetical protein